MKILTTRTYYSLTDLCAAAGIIGGSHPNFSGFMANEFGVGLYSIISDILSKVGVQGDLQVDNEFTKTL